MVHPAQLIEACKLRWIAGRAVATIVRSTVPMKSAIATIPKTTRDEGPTRTAGGDCCATSKCGFKQKPLHGAQCGARTLYRTLDVTAVALPLPPSSSYRSPARFTCGRCLPVDVTPLVRRLLMKPCPGSRAAPACRSRVRIGAIALRTFDSQHSAWLRADVGAPQASTPTGSQMGSMPRRSMP